MSKKKRYSYTDKSMYNIQSTMFPEYVMDVRGNSSKDGTEIIMWTQGDKKNNQKFFWHRGQLISVSTDKCISLNIESKPPSLHLRPRDETCKDDKKQLWRFDKEDAKFYSIHDPNLVITVTKGGKQIICIPVDLKGTQSLAQKFEFVDTEKSFFGSVFTLFKSTYEKVKDKIDAKREEKEKEEKKVPELTFDEKYKGNVKVFIKSKLSAKVVTPPDDPSSQQLVLENRNSKKKSNLWAKTFDGFIINTVTEMALGVDSKFNVFAEKLDKTKKTQRWTYVFDTLKLMNNGFDNRCLAINKKTYDTLLIETSANDVTQEFFLPDVSSVDKPETNQVVYPVMDAMKNYEKMKIKVTDPFEDSLKVEEAEKDVKLDESFEKFKDKMNDMPKVLDSSIGSKTEESEEEEEEEGELRTQFLLT